MDIKILIRILEEHPEVVVNLSYDTFCPPKDRGDEVKAQFDTYVKYISREKAAAAANMVAPEDIVITADTMVFLDDQRLGKPQDEADALRMLTALQGRRHTVCTGVTVRQGDRVLTESEATGVVFRPAEESELRAYIATGEPMDKAGSYGVQGKGALLVERLEGDFFNVMGLPVLRLSRMLAQFGIKLL